MRAKWWLLIALFGCGDGPGGVTSTKLTGYWNHEGERAIDQTVFGFVRAGDVAMDIEPSNIEYPAGKDLSVIYTRPLETLSLQQVATFTVEDGALLETVVGAVAAPPGTMYSTQILDYDGDTLTLASKNDPSGMRTYTHLDACPDETNVGWRYAGISDAVVDITNHAPAIAIAPDGHVYSLLGAYGSGERGFPRYQEIGKGCFPLVEVMPFFRQSSIALRGAEIHTVYEGFNQQLGHPEDYAIIHRWRATRTSPWQTETIAPPGSSPLYSLYTFADGNRLVVVASRTNRVTEVYRHDGSSWRLETVAGLDNLRVEDAAIGPDGELALLGLDKIVRIRGTSPEIITLPRYQSEYVINGGVRITDDGAIHAAWGYEGVSNAGMAVGLRVVYGVYDGTWKETELGPMMTPKVLAPHNGKRRVIATRAKDSPQLVMYEIAADGTVTSEMAGVDQLIDPTTIGLRKMAVAEGADGTVAACYNARHVFARRATPARPPRMKDFTVTILGQGRVYSDDGRVDCSATCTVKLREGSRVKLFKQGVNKRGFDQSCPFLDAYDREGYCWHDVLGPANAPFDPAVVQFDFR